MAATRLTKVGTGATKVNMIQKYCHLLWTKAHLERLRQSARFKIFLEMILQTRGGRYGKNIISRFFKNKITISILSQSSIEKWKTDSVAEVFSAGQLVPRVNYLKQAFEPLVFYRLERYHIFCKIKDNCFCYLFPPLAWLVKRSAFVKCLC